MRVNVATVGALALSATVGLVAAQDRPAHDPAPARSEASRSAAPRERSSDVKAIGDLLDSFVRAYNARNAEALGPLFTPDAEIEDEEGAITRGRDAIVQRFADIFKETKGDRLTAVTESLRFLGTDLAIEEGRASITAGPDSSPVENRYSVLYARQEGRWLHARIRDEPPEANPHRQLLALGWMLGEWVNESEDAVVQTRCTWSKDGNFLLRDFDVKVEGRIALSGIQRIGWDAQRKRFRTWIFDDQGGFAEGLMARDGDGDRWLIKSEGVRSDGKAVSVTSAIKILGKDRLLWESFDRTLDGEAIPDIDRFTLVRRAPKPGR